MAIAALRYGLTDEEFQRLFGSFFRPTGLLGGTTYTLSMASAEAITPVTVPVTQTAPATQIPVSEAIDAANSQPQITLTGTGVDSAVSHTIPTTPITTPLASFTISANAIPVAPEATPAPAAAPAPAATVPPIVVSGTEEPRGVDMSFTMPGGVPAGTPASLTSPTATPAAATPPPARTTPPTSDFPYTFDALLKDIARLYKNGENQLDDGLHSVFGSTTTPGVRTMKFDTCELKVHPDSGSMATPKGAEELLTPKDAYALIKSMMANENVRNEGINLRIVNADGTPKAASEYTEADIRNLALCFAAAEQSGVRIANERELFQGPFKGNTHLIKPSHGAMGRFTHSTDATIPALEPALASLNAAVQEPTMGRKRGILSSSTGDAMKAVGGMTNEDWDNVGFIQNDLLAIREAIKLPNGSYDPTKLAQLPDGKLDGLIADPVVRARVMAALGITAEKVDEARQMIKANNGVPGNGDNFVPQGSLIQEKTCFSSATRHATVAAQHFEKLMSDIARLKTKGADRTGASLPRADLNVRDDDCDETKEIQMVRIQLNAREKTATPGQIIDLTQELGVAQVGGLANRVLRLMVTAVTAETAPEKITGVSTLGNYFAETASFHMNRLNFLAPPGAAPTPTAAPATPTPAAAAPTATPTAP